MAGSLIDLRQSPDRSGCQRTRGVTRADLTGIEDPGGLRDGLKDMKETSMILAALLALAMRRISAGGK